MRGRSLTHREIWVIALRGCDLAEADRPLVFTWQGLVANLVPLYCQPKRDRAKPARVGFSIPCDVDLLTVRVDDFHQEAIRERVDCIRPPGKLEDRISSE